MRQFIVVSYDIPVDRRRTKVMKTLKNFGEHVQYSVFECRLEETELHDLRRRLKKLAKPEDSIRLYFIDQDDVKRIEVIGTGMVADDPLVYLR